MMSSSEKLGSTYKLFAETCRKCLYNTPSNQCAWFEYPHITQEIMEAKKNVKPGILACPHHKRKATLNSGFQFGKQERGYEPEDETEIMDEIDELDERENDT